jgi:hypothetical protein
VRRRTADRRVRQVNLAGRDPPPLQDNRSWSTSWIGDETRRDRCGSQVSRRVCGAGQWLWGACARHLPSSIKVCFQKPLARSLFLSCSLLLARISRRTRVVHHVEWVCVESSSTKRLERVGAGGYDAATGVHRACLARALSSACVQSGVEEEEAPLFMVDYLCQGDADMGWIDNAGLQRTFCCAQSNRHC